MIKVAFLTTWGSNCGISTYSEELCECLRDTGEVILQIIAPNEEGSCGSPPEHIPYSLVWNREDPNLPLTIPNAVAEYDVVHIQHEFGIFQHHDSFIQTLRFLKKQGKKVVITLHTVSAYGTWRSGIIDSIKSNVDAVLVHNIESYAAASCSRGSAKVILVNHGTRVNAAQGDRNIGLKYLGIPSIFHDARFGGSVGFMGPGKNIHETIKAWSDAVNRRLIDPSRSAFIACGEIHEDVQYYMKMLMDHKRDCGYSENIFIIKKFVPRKTMRHVMAVLDYAVLNTTSNSLSASGQVHALVAHGVPFAAADRPIYRDSIKAGAIPFELDKDNGYTLSTVNAIASLASNVQTREIVRQSLKTYEKSTGWPIQAERHLEIYKELFA